MVDHTFSRIGVYQHIEGRTAHLSTVLKNIGCISVHSKTTYGVSVLESVGYSPAHSVAARDCMRCSVLCGVHPRQSRAGSTPIARIENINTFQHTVGQYL